MAYDRQRAEDLNEDHHRRMSLDAKRRMATGENVGLQNLDHRSRAALLYAMNGCATRHRMRAQDEPISVLEIGAGRGGDREELLARLSAKEYVGIELVHMIAAEGNHVLPMALEECPETWNGKFHFIYSRHVMEHMLDVPLAMKTLKRLLAPNGVIGAVTPHYFPDPEPAHVAQLTIAEWSVAYRKHGLVPVYATTEEHACAEAHLVCVHEGWPLCP